METSFKVLNRKDQKSWTVVKKFPVLDGYLFFIKDNESGEIDLISEDSKEYLIFKC